MTQYVYIWSEPGLYTVGFYDPEGKWQAESDHTSKEEAAKRVHYLNGGNEAQSLSDVIPKDGFSPDPWTFDPDDPDPETVHILDAEGMEIATAQSLPDAALIAAAPDLLASCKEALEIIHTFHGDAGWVIYVHSSPEMQRLKTAIADAECEL